MGLNTNDTLELLDDKSCTGASVYVVKSLDKIPDNLETIEKSTR